jgi:hypothetical protein
MRADSEARKRRLGRGALLLDKGEAVRSAHACPHAHRSVNVKLRTNLDFIEGGTAATTDNKFDSMCRDARRSRNADEKRPSFGGK